MIKKIGIFLISIFAAFVTAVSFSIFYSDFFRCIVGQTADYCNLFYNLPVIFLGSILVFTILYFILLKELAKKSFLFVLLFASIFIGLILSYIYIIHPTRITGGSPGRYYNGQTVWSTDRSLLNRNLRKGDVVKFNITTTDLYQDQNGTFIGEIVGLPGESDISDADGINKIPVDSYSIERNHSGKYDLVKLEDIKEVVILP